MKRHRANKYSAQRTTVNGRVFHSKGESERYKELLLLEKAGKITKLECQPQFYIEVKQRKICTVIADFQYFEWHMLPSDSRGYWDFRVEDFKGHDTALSKIKRKLVKACHGIDIEVVK